MGLRIGTNLASIAAQRQMVQSQRNIERNMKQLASGDRFSDITEGAGDFAIAEQLKGQIRGLKAARFNADNATSFVQVAEGGLNEQSNILIRLRELAVQAASDTFSGEDREMLGVEYTQLRSEFDRIAQTTQFGSHKLLSGEEKNFEFQVGAYKGDENVIKYTSNTNTTASALGLSGTDVESTGDARDALETIDQALVEISRARANFGAIQSRFESVVNNAGVQIENLEGARSRIADTDFAEAVSDMFRNRSLQQYQIAVLAQANQEPQNVLRLLA